MFFLTAPRAGRLVDRFGERPLIIGGLALFTVGRLWMGLIADPGVVHAAMVASMMIAGGGFGMALAACQKSVMSAVQPRAMGKASGTFNTLMRLGGVVGVAIAVAAFSAAGSYATPHTLSRGFSAVMDVSAGLALIGAVAGVVSPRRREAAVADRSAVNKASVAIAIAIGTGRRCGVALRWRGLSRDISRSRTQGPGVAAAPAQREHRAADRGDRHGARR
jgi:MFS family permease